MKRTGLIALLVVAVSLFFLPSLYAAEQGEFTYDDFDEPKKCSMCHAPWLFWSAICRQNRKQRFIGVADQVTSQIPAGNKHTNTGSALQGDF
jgi:hypothetical protein